MNRTYMCAIVRHDSLISYNPHVMSCSLFSTFRYLLHILPTPYAQVIAVVAGIGITVTVAIALFAMGHYCEDDGVCSDTAPAGVVLLVLAVIIGAIFIPLAVYTKRYYNYIRDKEVSN